jgi:OFA family oxalate/formate antiporter-like MFS transporter
MEKTIENMDRNRLGILIRCLVILLITGVTNSAAVFVSPLAAHFNWTADAIANVSTTMLLCWTPGALIGGTLMSKIGARNAMLLGAVLFPLGTLTSSFVPQSSPWLLYVTFSFLQGLGNGLAYTVATYVSTGWYPDKRGLVSGLCMAFTGGSSAFLAPICSKLAVHRHHLHAAHRRPRVPGRVRRVRARRPSGACRLHARRLCRLRLECGDPAREL